jgi:hypothetical protein
MKHIFQWTVLLLAASGAFALDLHAPGGGPLNLRQTPDGRVIVASDSWRLEFDLTRGGALDTIAFPHGSGGNLLTRPFTTYVDGWSDTDAPRAEFHSSRQGDILRLEFSGSLAAAGRVAGPARFQTVWTITPFTVKVDQTLRFDADLPASTVGIGSTALRADIDEYGWRVGPADVPEGSASTSASYGKAKQAGSVLIQEHHAPLLMVFFKRYQEGLDFNAGSDLATWESALARHGGAGRYQARTSQDGRSIEVLREPLSVPSPVTIRKGQYIFSYYLGLPRVVEKSTRKYRHVAFGNHPWPSDELIRHWAESGVNIARLHNDYVEDENFWHDGAWPPYDEKGMAEMRRVIATCHRYHIQVVPYFSIHEFHPQAQGYAENERAWKRTLDQAGTVIHDRHGKGEFGAQMCLQSGWLDRRKADVEKVYRELGFDGIYYDWSANVPCRNAAHNAQWHTGMDGMIDLLAWTRRLVAPRGTLILHISGWLASIAYENYGDLIVNMEENSQIQGLPRLDQMALMTVLTEAVPRSPCPSYRLDRPLERNQNNIAQEVVFGLFPWSGPDGPAAEETFKLFRAFQPYRLEDYRLHNAASGAVETAWPEVYGAVYASPQQAVVVISNTSDQPRKNILWRVKPETLGFAPARQVTVKDTTSGRTTTLPWSALTDGTLSTGLQSFGYRLFEIQSLPR